MAKITGPVHTAFRLDCGHIVRLAFSIRPHKEVNCSVCADNETQVKAARVEGIEAVKVALHGHYLPLVSNDMIIDKLIEATK